MKLVAVVEADSEKDTTKVWVVAFIELSEFLKVSIKSRELRANLTQLSLFYEHICGESERKPNFR